jgi:hypothetical protein
MLEKLLGIFTVVLVSGDSGLKTSQFFTSGIIGLLSEIFK